MQRVRVTEENYGAWLKNIEGFVKQGRLIGDVPADVMGMYILIHDDARVEVESPDKVVKPVCPKCKGTGQFRTGQGGECYLCAGKGWVTVHDTLRNKYYHQLREEGATG